MTKLGHIDPNRQNFRRIFCRGRSRPPRLPGGPAVLEVVTRGPDGDLHREFRLLPRRMRQEVAP